MGCSKTSTSLTSLDWRERVLTTAKSISQFKRRFKSFQKSFSFKVGLQQRVAGFTTCLFTRCENSSQNLGCSKTSTSDTSLDWRKRVFTTANLIWQFKWMFKSFQTSIPFKWDFNKELRILQHVYSLDMRIHHRIWDT